MEVVVGFEASNKWPDELVPLRAAKTAMLVQMSSLIEEAIKAANKPLKYEGTYLNGWARG